MNKAPLVRLAGAATLLLGLSVNYQFARLARPALAAPVSLTKTQKKKLEEVAAASLFGQFRSNLADFLWLKVDKYLHRGIDLRAMTEEEKKALIAARHAAQHAQGVDHTHVPDSAGHRDTGEEWANREHRVETTVVLAPHNDWRGILGDIEREVKPYGDMTEHGHRDPKEALPLFRLMTWTNPKFIPGYAVGAVMIARDEKAYPEALAFIQEGENNNPESIEIQATYAFLLLRGQRFGARGDASGAALHAERGVQLGLERDPSTLTMDEVEGWQDCVRWRVLAYRESGEAVKARQSAVEGLKLFPQDVICRNYLQSHR